MELFFKTDWPLLLSLFLKASFLFSLPTLKEVLVRGLGDISPLQGVEKLRYLLFWFPGEF